MSDNYDAVYQAVRSKIGYVDIDGAIKQAIANENIGYEVRQLLEEIRYSHTRPCILLKPEMSIDGNMWCASYGNAPQGIQGFGETPDKAMDAFDKEYYNAKITIHDKAVGK